MRRKQIRELRQTTAAETKGSNRLRKDQERRRRKSRMIATLQSGSLPYGPAVMSWLSRELNKPAGCIQKTDIDAILSAER